MPLSMQRTVSAPRGTVPAPRGTAPGHTSPVRLLQPALRLRPAPRAEPPLVPVPPCTSTDRRAVHGSTGVAGEQGALPLLFALPEGIPASTTSRRLRRGPSAKGAKSADWGPRATGRDELADPAAWAGRLVQALLEVEAGLRPGAQLGRWLREDVALRVRKRAALTAGRTASAVAARGRTGRQPAAAQTAAARGRLLVRSVHVCEPEDGVAEVTAVVLRADRAVAVAVRLEGLDGRWLCTAYDVLEPGSTTATGLEEDTLVQAS